VSRIYKSSRELAKRKPPEFKLSGVEWWGDYADYHRYYHESSFSPDVTIFEEDREPIVRPTGLLGPDGSQIVTVEEHPGMDFIGFIPPWELERITEENEQQEAARNLKG